MKGQPAMKGKEVYYPDHTRLHRIRKQCQTCRHMTIEQNSDGTLSAICTSDKRKQYLNLDKILSTRPEWSCSKFWEVDNELEDMIHKTNELISKKQLGDEQ